MSEQDVSEIVFPRFLDAFGTPQREDLKAYYEVYADVLKGWRPDVLSAGVEAVMRDHVYPEWPVPGKVYQACESIAHKFKPADHARLTSDDPVDLDKKQRVDALVKQAIHGFQTGEWSDDIQPTLGVNPTPASIAAAKWRAEVRASHGSVDKFLREKKPRNWWEA
jgi:hypothetical protein